MNQPAQALARAGAAFPEALPARIGAHEIVARVGVGASSEVLLAITRGPREFARPVVIKRLRGACAVDPDAKRTLEREAVAYARLAHPNVLRLYELLAENDQLALVLEYVPGMSLGRLRALLRDRRESIGDAAAMVAMHGVFSALAAAHAARDPITGEFVPVVHRDVNPSNVLLGWDGAVKLADFGIAKLTGVEGDTRVGLLKGTYGYMAPEQVNGEPITPRTDLYCACLLLRELLLRRVTYVRHGVPELELLQAMAQPSLAPIEALRTGVPDAVCEVLRRGLRVDPAERVVTASEAADAIAAAVDLRAAREELASTLEEVRPPDRFECVEQSIITNRREQAIVDLVARERRDGEAPRRREGSVSGVVEIGHAAPSEAPPSPVARTLPAPPQPAVARTGDARGPGAFRHALVGFAMAAAAASTLAAFLALPFASRLARDARPCRAELAHAAVARTVGAKAAAPPRTARRRWSNSGTLQTPRLPVDHRVYVDGRCVGSSGASFDVRCGWRLVKVGSRGQPQAIEVPCGGSVRVSPRW